MNTWPVFKITYYSRSLEITFYSRAKDEEMAINLAHQHCEDIDEVKVEMVNQYHHLIH